MQVFSSKNRERKKGMSTNEVIPFKVVQLPHRLYSLNLEAIADILPNIQAGVDDDTSWRVYQQDIKTFADWLHDCEIDVHTITLVHMLNYRKHLKAQGKANITINRMFTVARRVVDELAKNGAIEKNPLVGARIKPLETNTETTHVALKETQAKDLLAAINTRTLKGKRDYAMVSLMLRCGLRREEVQSLNIGNIKMKQGHYVADIEDGKGNKPATVKLPPDVWRYIDEYMQALQAAHPRTDARLDAPLFVSFRKGDKPSYQQDQTGKLVEKRIDIKAIETVVKDLAEVIGVDHLTPHGLRATFITLALEHQATLEQTQYAARHKDPRTTERYRKRKMNLDNNAVDKLSFLARED